MSIHITRLPGNKINTSIILIAFHFPSMSSAGLAELMQKLNSTMTNQNKIGSTTTVN